VKITDVKQDSVRTDLQRFMRYFCLPSEAQEMICAALKPDEAVLCKVAVDRRGVAGAISYQFYPDGIHVHALGSLVPGTGTLLMAAVGKIARQKHLPLTVSATTRSKSFYDRLGFTPIKGLKPGSIIRMVKP
jgi:hypothetical protein